MTTPATTTMTPEGGATDAPDAADRGITALRVPRPPVFILAADYIAARRAEGVACVDDTDPSG